MNRAARWRGASALLLLAVGLAGWAVPPRAAPTAEDEPPAIEFPAETPDEFFAAGFLRHMAGDLDEAVELYRKSIARKPTAPGHTFLGWAYAHQGRLDDAIAECEKAIQIDPEYGNPWNDIGSYLMAKGELDGAIPYLKRALEAKRYCCPHFPHLNLGNLYAEQGKFREAKREFERVLELQPGFPPAMLALRQIEAILSREEQGSI